MMAISEAQKKASAKYVKENVREIKLKINKRTESELYEWMENINNKQGYLKDLIIADMTHKQNVNMRNME